MLLKSLFLIILIPVFYNSFGQKNYIACDSSLYIVPTYVQKYYNEGKYVEAAKAARSFWENCQKNNIKNELVYITVYNVACCWSILNKKDSAFILLNNVINEELFIPLFTEMKSDGDFANLRSDPRWDDLIEKGNLSFKSFAKNIDSGLVKELEKIRYSDQIYRSEVAKLNREKALPSKIKEVWKKATIQDSLDMIKIEEIIDRYGWPGPRLVGFNGNKTIFLVIQHAPLNVQQRYLPLMRNAVKENLASPGDLAFLEDRVRVRQKKKQIYGTQLNADFTKAFPIQDSANVDCRRFKVGLVTLDRYIQNW